MHEKTVWEGGKEVYENDATLVSSRIIKGPMSNVETREELVMGIHLNQTQTITK